MSFVAIRTTPNVYSQINSSLPDYENSGAVDILSSPDVAKERTINQNSVSTETSFSNSGINISVLSMNEEFEMNNDYEDNDDILPWNNDIGDLGDISETRNVDNVSEQTHPVESENYQTIKSDHPIHNISAPKHSVCSACSSNLICRVCEAKSSIR